MPKTVAILQSNYIPWKGYFDIINIADEFVLLDDVQYTKRDWRNRNQIKTAQGLSWLTIPVVVKGKYNQKINQTMIADRTWAAKHWRGILGSYAKSTYFDQYKNSIEQWYSLAKEFESLSEVNRFFITNICQILGINTRISSSVDYHTTPDRNTRLLSICEQLDASVYLSGPAAKTYLDESLFDSRNIHVRWMDYSNYPTYKQLHNDFEHSVTVLDLLFNTGENAINYLKSANSTS